MFNEKSSNSYLNGLGHGALKQEMNTVSVQAVSCCVYDIPHMFEWWAHLVDHLLLLKSSMGRPSAADKKM